jgi:ATP-binding cassette subfamily B protein
VSADLTPDTDRSPPDGDLTESPSRRGVLRASGRFARPHGRLLSLAVCTGVVASLLTSIVPVIVGRLTDALLAGEQEQALLLAAAGVVIALVQVAAAGAGRAWLARAGEYVVRDVRDRLVDRLSVVGLRFVERHRVGELLQRSTAEIAALSAFIRESLTEILVTVATVLLLVLVLVVESWQLALVLLVVFIPPSLLILWRFRRRAAAAFGAEAAAEADVQARFAENVRVRDLLAGASPVGRRRFLDSFDALNDAAIGAQLRTVVLGRWIGATTLVEGATLAALLLVGSTLVGAGTLSAGVVVSFLVGGMLLFSRFSDLVALVGAIEEAATGAARTHELLSAIDRPSGGPTGDQGDGDGLELTDVAFGYSSTPVISDVTYRFRAGRRYGIAGASGAGKSTLVKLLAGLYRPDRGTVRVGGVIVCDLPPAERVRAVAFVPQQVQLGSGTLADELRLARPMAGDEVLREAAGRIGLGRWLDALPDGLATTVGADGGLSAGERQLVALIRVCLVDARVLLLDEATSDIDPVTAELVEQAVERLAPGRTIVVVAHRWRTLERLDEVLMLKGGRLHPRASAG